MTVNLNDKVSWIANKRSGALKHRARGKVIELTETHARIEMKVGPGGSGKNRFWKLLGELRVEDDKRQEAPGEAAS